MALPKYLSEIIKSSDKAVLAKQLLDKKAEFITTGSVSMDWATGGGFTRGTMTTLWGPPGCHAKGTKVLMFDGSMKNVEDVVADDLLMGPDSRPRVVLGLCRGSEMMYKITPNRGEPFVVNGEHILSLKEMRRGFHDNVVNITVEEFLKQSNTFKHHFGLYYAECLKFPEQTTKLPIDPYIFGLWLGDGDSKNPGLTSADSEIAEKWSQWGESVGLVTRVTGENNPRNSKARHYFLVKENSDHKKGSNPLLNALRDMNVFGNKHIPDCYLVSSVKERRALLAGLIDTDGDGTYGFSHSTSITSKYEHLADQMVFLAKSLGLFAQKREIWNRAHKDMEKKKYWRVSIYGDLSVIPTVLPGKKFIKKDYTQATVDLITGFTAEPIGVDEYYGFSLNEDHLYVMEHFFVTHNSGKSLLMLKTMANEQKTFPNKVAIAIDSEYSFDAKRAEDMGVDLSRLIVIQSNTIEGAFGEFGKISEEMVKAKDVCFIGVDSIRGFSSLSEEKSVLEGDMDKAINAYGGVAKTIGPVLNLLNRVTNEIGCTTILCNHAMANMDSRTSAYYPYILSGGQKLKHLCSTILFIDKVNNKASRIVSEMTDVQGNPITIGNLMRVKVTKSRKTVEGKVAEFYWNLENGEFEQKESELFNLAKSLGVLKGTGSWYTYGPEKMGLKKQGKAWIDTLTSDKNMYNKILNECHSATSRLGAEDDFCADIIDISEVKEEGGK